MLTRIEGNVFVDAHAHLHGCFDLKSALCSAFENFRTRASESDEPTAHWRGCLMVSELDATPPDVAAAKTRLGIPGFSVTATNEPGSVTVREDQSGDCIDMIFGNQIVCYEGLEALIYGHKTPIPPGLSLKETVEAALDQKAMIVLPWGFGKWKGRRGVVLDEFLSVCANIDKFQERIFIGDSAARLAVSSTPAPILKAELLGFKNLPGSDPLPFENEFRKLGISGFEITLIADHMNPLDTLIDGLSRKQSQLDVFHSGESIIAFTIKQVNMQLRKHGVIKANAK